jgi:hypothetical protein
MTSTFSVLIQIVKFPLVRGTPREDGHLCMIRF